MIDSIFKLIIKILLMVGLKKVEELEDEKENKDEDKK